MEQPEFGTTQDSMTLEEYKNKYQNSDNALSPRKTRVETHVVIDNAYNLVHQVSFISSGNSSAKVSVSFKDYELDFDLVVKFLNDPNSEELPRIVRDVNPDTAELMIAFLDFTTQKCGAMTSFYGEKFLISEIENGPEIYMDYVVRLVKNREDSREFRASFYTKNPES